MKCPKCNSQTMLLKTVQKENTIYRLKKCRVCGELFESTEYVTTDVFKPHLSDYRETKRFEMRTKTYGRKIPLWLRE